MESFKDCSTHKENVDLLILEKIQEDGPLISITTNNDENFNIIWLNIEDALKLAKEIIKICKK
jgi:hypothetical protein